MCNSMTAFGFVAELISLSTGLIIIRQIYWLKLLADRSLSVTDFHGQLLTRKPLVTREPSLDDQLSLR